MFENKFPIDVLPCIIKNAINEAHQNTKAPIPLIAASALGVISLVCQQQIDVVRYNNLSGPTALFFLILAESGERKSTVDKLFMEPIYQMETKLNQQYQILMDSYRQNKKIFDIKQKALSKQIAKEYCKNKDVSDLESQLKELLNSEPKEPITFKFCFNDATPAAIKDYLSKGWNSIGLMSDEAGIIFEGHALNELGFINKMWDGSSFSISRKSEGERLIQDPRMTLSLMAQPTLFRGFLQKKGDKVKDIGFLARCLICYPRSTQGDRLIENTTSYSEHLTQFHQKVIEILEKSINDYTQGVHQKRTLQFTPEAEKKWIEFYNTIERALKNPEILYHHKEFGAKIAENIARIAALIHFFSSDEEFISIDSVNSGYAIADWFYREQVRLFPQKNNISELDQDAEELFQWINKYFNERGVTMVSKNIIRQYGPNKFRNTTKLNVLLEILKKQLSIFLMKKNKTIYITAHAPFEIQPNIDYFNGNIDTSQPMMKIMGEIHQGVPNLTIKDII